MTGRLFVYGTLRDPARQRAVAGRTFPARPATLRGFRRVDPLGGYPYLLDDAGGIVDGLVLGEIDAASLRRLDCYEDEGRLYVRRAVTVAADGVELACDVYVGAAIARG
ncbi:MAG: gamma-glutamylcyclotransferase [bacterium]|nr:gamma-glutamylcyclotransferase [bacterium]